MDDLEEAFQKFALTSREQGVICIEEEDVCKGVSECKLSLVGKIYGDKIANVAGIKSFITNTWNYPRILMTQELG